MAKILKSSLEVRSARSWVPVLFCSSSGGPTIAMSRTTLTDVNAAIESRGDDEELPVPAAPALRGPAADRIAGHIRRRAGKAQCHHYSRRRHGVFGRGMLWRRDRDAESRWPREEGSPFHAVL